MIAEQPGDLCQDKQAIKRSLPTWPPHVMALCRNRPPMPCASRNPSRAVPSSALRSFPCPTRPFRPRMPIVSVRDAIVRIGLSTLTTS